MRDLGDYSRLFDRQGTEVGTLVIFRSGTRRLTLDPQRYLRVERGGYSIPRPPWPLYDADGQQVTP
jgi:hypothetical protein